MPSLVTLQGIKTAIANLHLNPETLKARLAAVVSGYFSSDADIQTITSIPAEELIKQIWDIDQPEEVRAKRKNLSSLKSSLNKSLKDLSKKDLNDEGIILGRDNVFIVSEERKDSLIQQLGITPGSLKSVKELFSVFRNMVKDISPQDADNEDMKEILADIEATKKIIQKRSEGGEEEKSTTSIDQQGGDSDQGEAGPGNKDDIADHKDRNSDIADSSAGNQETDAMGINTEPVIEDWLDDGLDIVEVDEDEIPGADGEDTEAEGEPGDIGEVDELDADAETIIDQWHDDEAEVIEVDEDELPGAGGEDTGAEGEPGDIGEADELDTDSEPIIDQWPDDEAEVIEIDEDEVPGAGGEDTGAEGEPGDIGEVDELDAEAETIIDQWHDDEAEVIEVDEAELPEADSEDTGAEGELGDIGEADELDADAETIIDQWHDDEAEVIEVDEAELPEADSENTGAEGELGDIGEADELDADAETIINQWHDDDESEIIEIDETELPEADGEDTGSNEDLDEIGGDIESDKEEDEIQEIDAEEFDDFLKHRNKLLGGKKPGLLEVLSEYIDPADALAPGEVLAETQEDYIAQILQRFTPKFIKIPAASYIIGSTHPNVHEIAAKKIQIKPFYIGQFPVTNDLFELFIHDTGYETEAEKTGYGLVYEGQCVNHIDPDTGLATMTINRAITARPIKGANWQFPAGPGAGGIANKHNHPVVQISRKDAMAFAAWAGKRLPSEVEWEAAARGDKGQLFPWGNIWEQKNGNFSASQTGDTTPVDKFGRKSASPFGVYDLLGNVWEWTSSTHSSGPAHILKGGCWTSSGVIACSYRLAERDTWANIIGFRCAVSGYFK